MTTEEVAVMKAMSTAKVRRNYWLCQAQIELCKSDSPHLDDTAAQLQDWQWSYLDELVQRNERI